MGGLRGTLSRVNQRGYDYDIEQVPLDDRKSTASLSAIWLGYTVQFATIMVGGIVGLGMSFKSAVAAIVLGNAILALLSITTGLIGRRLGLGFSMLTRYPFGHRGSIIPSVFCGIVQLGWLTFCYWIFANAFQNMFQLFNPELARWGFFVGVLVSTLLTVVPLFFGFEGPKWVSWISIPLIVLPLLYVMSVLVSNVGGMQVILNTYHPPQPISFVKGVTLVMGAWLFGAITSPDFVRLGKTDAAAYIAPPIGLIIGESLVLILGALTAASTFGATWNPVEASTKLGAGASFAVLLLYLAAMWATNVPCAWSASLQFANAFQQPKTVFAISLGLIAPFLAILIQYSMGALVAIDAFIGFLSSVIPPVGGILVAEYWFIRKQKLPEIMQVKRRWNPVAYLSWFLAAAINYWTNQAATQAGPSVSFEYGLPGLNGFILAIIFYWILNSLAVRAKVSWADYDTDEKLHPFFTSGR